jgi:hypothetical protein
MFGSVVRKIDFGTIDSVKLILAKIDLKIKWFMFGFIHAKVSWTNNLSVRINSRIRSYDFYLQVESILLLRNQAKQNQFYTSSINSDCSRIETKHVCLVLRWKKFDIDRIILYN